MKPTLYAQVHQLSVGIVNASAIEDQQAEWNAYHKLQALCSLNENTENNHPLQWEALADFTSDPELAVALYQKALLCSEALGLKQYSASINLAMAERYQQMQKTELALKRAGRANEWAKTINDAALQTAISQFLLEVMQQT